LIGQPETVRVAFVWRQKFRTDGDDFRGEHQAGYLPQRTQGKKSWRSFAALRLSVSFISEFIHAKALRRKAPQRTAFVVHRATRL
jgi:hypothetical protein